MFEIFLVAFMIMAIAFAVAAVVGHVLLFLSIRRILAEDAKNRPSSGAVAPEASPELAITPR